MLIERTRHEGIRRGEVTVLFRRWARCQATAGRVYRTAAGRIAVQQVQVVEPQEIRDEDAMLAGYASAREAVADLRGREGDPVYLLRIRFLEEPDPREVLAASETLSAGDEDAIAKALTRLDAAARSGPWTRAALLAVQQSPGVRAVDLAARLGRDTASLKADVRKLKNLGLTVSLDIGYRLSPRGEAYLTGGETS